MPIHDWARVNAGVFHHFHHEWISTTSRALNAGLLPPGYYALPEQIAGGLGPDVLTLGGPRPVGGGNGAPATGPLGGAIAVATTPPGARFTASVEPEQYAHKRKRVVIRHSSGDSVVAVVEIV